MRQDVLDDESGIFVPSVGTGHNKLSFYADFYHLGLAGVFSSAAFLTKMHRNKGIEIKSKTSVKQKWKRHVGRKLDQLKISYGFWKGYLTEH